MPLPDPGEDDGNLISHLVLGQIAEAVEQQQSREQAVVLEESGAPPTGAQLRATLRDRPGSSRAPTPRPPRPPQER